jgi:two-component sensor histidine kinase
VTAPQEIRRQERSALPWWREVRVPVPGEPAAPPAHGWACRSALSIEARPTAPRQARLHARKVISGWGLHDQADTVELVVSELVTNAVRASADSGGRSQDGVPRVRLRLATDRTLTLVEVWDENPGLPAPVQPDLDDESGRGLVLVEALCERWGWELSRDRRGKLVWALVGHAPSSLGPNDRDRR